MNLGQFNRILRRTLLLPVLALLMVAGILAWQIQNTTTAMSAVDHSDQIITKTTEIQKLIVDQETGLRGYEVTGDDKFLEPYKAAEQPLHAAFAILTTLVQNSGTGQEERTARMQVQYQEWLTGFAQPIVTMVHAGGNVSDSALNLRGKVMMDALRATTEDIEDHADSIRAERLGLLQHRIRLTLFLLIALAIVVGCGIGLYTRSEMQSVSEAFQRSLDDLRKYSDEVYESEQRLRITLQAIGDGVIVCGTDGIVEMMNPLAQDLCGWTITDAKGHHLDEVFHIVNEDTRLLVESPVAKVIRLNRVVGLANHTILIRRDGQELNIDDSGAPIRDQNGVMVGIVMVFRDITMERKTQSALLANEKLAVAGRLAATIAHEIHNPLDSVSNLLYLLRNDPTSDDATQYIELAQQELTRVTQISRTMLSLYREAKAPVPVPMKDMLEGILLLLDRKFLDRNILLCTELPQEITVEGFPAELRQVFNNLIINAAEAISSQSIASAPTASTAGTREIRIRLVPAPAATLPSGTLRKPGAIVEIIDNGAGIPQKTLDRLFEPFFTTKGEQGTGLGLWVSRGIVQKHEGEINIESSMDAETHGTTVRVYLPAKPHILREIASLPPTGVQGSARNILPD